MSSWFERDASGAVSTFRTARLHAERMDERHADYLAALHRDELVMALIGGVRSAAESAAWLERNLEHWSEHGFGQWMFRDATGQPVGRGGLRWIDRCVGEELVEVGYVFQRSAWGIGLATEAVLSMVEVSVDAYDFQQLGAITRRGNDASTRVLLKSGFTFERWVDHEIGPHRFLRRVDSASRASSALRSADRARGGG